MKHNSNFKYDLEWGKQGETVVAEIQQGEKTEVKSEKISGLRQATTIVNTKVEVKRVGLKRHKQNGGQLISTVEIDFVLT